jgi:hypothetical protein
MGTFLRTELRWIFTNITIGAISGLLARYITLIGGYIINIIAYFAPLGTFTHPDFTFFVALPAAIIAGFVSELMSEIVQRKILQRVTRKLIKWHFEFVIIGIVFWPIIAAIGYYYLGDPLFLGSPGSGKFAVVWACLGMLLGLMKVLLLRERMPGDEATLP